MNRRMVFYTLGQMVLLCAALLLLPLAVAFTYGEACVAGFCITIGICFVLGITMMLVFHTKNRDIYAKEGFVIVALTWLSLSALGALPFWISGEIPSYADAFFETVSGFTTTGASILVNVEKLSRGMLFWRSFTHWIGGMGVLVFVMAILPNVSERSMHIIRAEMPGPIVGKLVPRVKDTAKILYLIYIAMSVAETVMLICGGMSLFDSVVHTFGTAGTGGFGIKLDSVAGYSPYIQWVIAAFMLLFGINFNLFYLLLIRKFRSVFRSTELRTYFAIIVAAIVTVAVNIYPVYDSVEESVRLSAFQVSSVITTTGYSTCDFDMWPGLSKAVLLVLMFIGACAGSTGGGLKVSRLVILVKMVKNELKYLLHPRSVNVVKFEGKKLDGNTLHNISNYFALYIVGFFVIFLLISADGFNFETNFSAVAACYNNIGPGFGAVGPAASYAGYSLMSKLLLSFAMLLGRLELFPLLLAFAPSTWTKR